MKKRIKISQGLTIIKYAPILVITRMHIIIKNLAKFEPYLLCRCCNTAITSAKSIF